MQKNRWSSTQTIMHNTCENSMQNEKITMKKNCNNNVAILQQSRVATTQKKERTQRIMHTKRFCTVETCSMCAKEYQRGLQAPTTWPTSHGNISGKLRVRYCQSIKFFKFFKIKSSTNQIWAVIDRSYVYDLTCVKVSHLFQ